ncbi:MAG: glutamate-5-semialdehyde dehydrogenase [Clostridia bacterium]|nr:glutamate-5-semialdehyde dehydrogenase [Clostridia bacterium]
MSIREEVELLCINAKNASLKLGLLSTEKKNEILLKIAEHLKKDEDSILEANKLDLSSAEEAGVAKAMLDRLTLTSSRLDGIRDSLVSLVSLEDPVGKYQEWTAASGIQIRKAKVPLGVVAMIYEARPNVTVDSAALCLKTGNAVVLRGGREAINTNIALVRSMKDALDCCGIDPHSVELVENTDRESSMALMTMRGLVDVLIPRGGKGLIKSTLENSTVPVIETGAGNCHIYIDESADIEKAINITVNAKCSRPSVCNAAETLLVHAAIAASFLPALSEKLNGKVELRGCPRTRVLIPSSTDATEEDYYTEYNDYILAIKVVDDLSSAIDHINKHSTAHSEAIVTEDDSCAERFLKEVDSAAVYVNASTRFTDGGEFGFGAEIGISTQKLHVRGPMGLFALTTEKYMIRGNGNLR